MRRIVLVIAALALLVLAACGGGGGGERSDAVSIDTLHLAASNTQDAESARFEVRVTGLISASATGVVSGDGRNGSVLVDLGDGRSVDERVVDGVAYFDASSFDGASDGARWYRVDLDALSDAFGGASSFGSFGTTPADALQLLDDIAGPVTTVGDDTVAGSHATHYRASLKTPAGDTPIDVWIDDLDRVVKLDAEVPGVNQSVSMQITEFGVPVQVEAPPPDQVGSLDIGSLFRPH